MTMRLYIIGDPAGDRLYLWDGQDAEDAISHLSDCVGGDPATLRAVSISRFRFLGTEQIRSRWLSEIRRDANGRE